MYSCVIIDDEKHMRESLSKMIEMFCPTLKIKGVSQDIFEAETLINEVHPDLIFLDVEMPGGSGFDLLEKFNNIDFKVIFTTAHAAYAIKAIKYAAMDYLLKPINIDELKEAINKFSVSNHQNEFYQQQLNVLKNNRGKSDFDFSRIALPVADAIKFFDVSDIVYCEADRAYCKFHINDQKKILISKPMSEYEDILSQSNFIKVHKSYIINKSHVDKMLKGPDGGIVMSNGAIVPVAVRRKSDVAAALGVK